MAGTGSARRAVSEIPPCNLDAERAVLGAVLLEGRAALRGLLLRPQDFFLEAHRDVFHAMLALDGRGEPIDVLTVAAQLDRRGGDLGRVGPAMLALLMEHASILVNVPSYARLVADEARRRDFQALGERLRQGALNGASAGDLAAWTEDLLTDHRARDARRRPDEAPSELNALLSHRFPPRPDVVGRGLLPREGILVVGGAPKVGKSLLLDNLCLRRARGQFWLAFPTDPGVTLVVQSELRAPAVAERFRTMLKDDPEPVPAGRLHVKTRRGVMLDTPEGLAQIMAWLDETGADVLRVDPLARHMAGDENSNRDMGAVVRAVDSLIERYGVAVILAHHPTKPTKDEPRTGGMRLRGAGALFGAADTVIMMDRTESGFTLQFELRHAAAPNPMCVSRTDDLWLVPDGPDPDLVAVAALTVPGPLTYGVLADAVSKKLKVSEATAKRRIPDAVAAGVLVKGVDGRYQPGTAYYRAVPRSHRVSADA